MLKLALIGFTIVVGLLVALSFSPEKVKVFPNTFIELNEAQLTLYPSADPEATWSFKAQKTLYEPDTRESTLFNLSDGKRVVNDEVDFTLNSNKVTIDQADNLRGDLIYVHINNANWDLDMHANEGRQVLIDQNIGKFEVPRLLYRGDGISESRDENVRMNFDLTEFEAGGPGTIGYNSFIDEY